MSDSENFKQWIPRRVISPLASPEEREDYQLQREAELRSILRGPCDDQTWLRADEELNDLLYGRCWSEEQDWEYGR